MEAPADVDEWVVSGLTKMESVDVKPGWVKESAVSMECEVRLPYPDLVSKLTISQLFHSHDIRVPGSSEITHTLVLGLIKRVHTRNSVLTADGSSVDPHKLKVVSRLGGPTYATVGREETFDLKRPSWKRMKEQLEAKGEK